MPKNTGFHYPLTSLYSSEEVGWKLTSDFLKEVRNKVSKFTQTEDQNNILEIFERLTSVLNDLNFFDILRAKHGVNEIAMLKNYIEISKTEIGPNFTISQFLFRKHRLNDFFVKLIKKASINRQVFQKMLFPEGIIYNRELDRVRTTRVNSFFSLIPELTSVLEGHKKGDYVVYDKIPRWVILPRIIIYFLYFSKCV